MVCGSCKDEVLEFSVQVLLNYVTSTHARFSILQLRSQELSSSHPSLARVSTWGQEEERPGEEVDSSCPENYR